MVKKTERGKKKGVVDAVVNRGAWTAMEDQKLVEYVRAHGDKNWRTLPAKAGLNRCGKSCRLRWLNYLRPGIKRGNISDEEEDLIIRLHNLIGNRWSLIAGRLPGRTDNEIKNHWNTHLSRRSVTIDDLNHKMNQNIESARGHACAHLATPFASTHGFAATMGAAVDNVDDDWALDATAEPLQLSSELCRSELDMEQLFDLMPNLDGGQFGVEAYYGARGEEGYHDLLASEVSGTQAVWDASGFDDLDRFLGCEDLIAFSFLD